METAGQARRGPQRDVAIEVLLRRAEGQQREGHAVAGQSLGDWPEVGLPHEPIQKRETRTLLGQQLPNFLGGHQGAERRTADVTQHAIECQGVEPLICDEQGNATRGQHHDPSSCKSCTQASARQFLRHPVIVHVCRA